MLRLYSNPDFVKTKARRLKLNQVYESTRKNKKYMIHDGHHFIHFGQMGYEDYTKHKDDDRRKRYLARATKIKGDWKEDKYSPNNLSIHILW